MKTQTHRVSRLELIRKLERSHESYRELEEQNAVLRERNKRLETKLERIMKYIREQEALKR